MFYQTIRIGKPPKRTNNPASYLAPPGPTITLDQPSPVALKDWWIAGRVNHELSLMSQRILQVMPPGGGVLVAVGYHEEHPKVPVEIQRPAQNVISMSIAGTGRVAALVTKIHLMNPTKLKRAPAGWSGKTVYLWVTQ